MTTRNPRSKESKKIISRLADYYSRRAGEYELIYEKPERQPELEALRRRVRQFAAGQQVLDVACGTGYWTSALAAEAAHVHGLDLSIETLRVAMTKGFPEGIVTLAVGDVFSRSYREGAFSAMFAGFWLSHIPRGDLVDCVRNLVASLGGGSRVFLIDNCYVAGSSTAISCRDASGNTFQDRELSDGSRFRVMKNFYAGDELHDLGAAFGTEVSVQFGRYFWALEFVV